MYIKISGPNKNAEKIKCYINARKTNESKTTPDSSTVTSEISLHVEKFRHDIVAYLLKARTVEAEKQPLLGNNSYKRSRGKRHVRYDVTQQKRGVAGGVLCRSAPGLLRNSAVNTSLQQ
jgi:hypothetical protein